MKEKRTSTNHNPFSVPILQFVSHPFLFKRVKMRWQKGFPFMSQGIAGAILWLLFIVLETALTPLLLPMIAFVSYKDQVKQSKKNGDGDGDGDGFQKEEQVQMSEMMSPNGGDEANELSKTAYSNLTGILSNIRTFALTECENKSKTFRIT